MRLEAYKLHRLLQANYKDVSPLDWRCMYGQLHRVYKNLEDRTHQILLRVRSTAPLCGNPKVIRDIQGNCLDIYREFRGFFFLDNYLESICQLIENSVQPPPLVFQQILQVLTEVQNRLVIEAKLTQALLLGLEEACGREV